ncbi:MAG: hypothetical protein ABR564_00410 [Candidatus Dormibacteria bacterium]
MSSAGSPRPARQVAVATCLALVFLLVFVGCFVIAEHKPVPHDLPVGLVTSPSTAARLGGALDRTSPGALSLSIYPDRRSAEQALHEQRAYAVVLEEPATLHLLVTGATGEAPESVISTAIGRFARATGVPLRVDDIQPISPEDPRGLALFLGVLGMTLSAVLFRLLCFLLTRGATSWRVAILGALPYAVLAGLGTATLLDPVLGVFSGHFLERAGLAALFSAAVVLDVAAFQRLLGIRGTALAVLIIVILGNSASGAPVDYRMLPGGFRELSQIMLPGALVTGLRHALYFQSSAILSPVAVMCGWALAGIAVILLAAARWKPPSVA